MSGLTSRLQEAPDVPFTAVAVYPRNKRKREEEPLLLCPARPKPR